MKKLIKIAIVEDNSDIQELLLDIFTTQKNFSVTGVFDNKTSALKNLPLSKPDIVLMDIGLPDGSGIECIKELKLRFPEIEFMVCTSFEDDKTVFEALEAGASSYILKRSKPEFIISAVKELYTGGSPMNPDIARILVNRLFNNKKLNGASVLTQREYEIMKLLAEGNLYKEIADRLEISINTLKAHCYNIYQKLHVNNKTEAIIKVFGRN